MTKSKSKTKKSEKNKDGTTLTSSGKTGPPINETPPTPSPSPVNVGSKNVPKLWFQAEIQSMMHAFGDCRRPSLESAAIIEEIVHQQIASLIVRAAEVTNMRGGRFMSIEDIIFLMRRNKDKLKRLIKFLTFKDMKSKTQKLVSQEDEDALEAATELKGNKRRKISYDFLNTIDHTGDLLSLFDDDEIDEVKQERNERAERISRTLDHQQYLDYNECRQANFNKKAGKFKEWLDCGSLIDMKPNTPVMEVFSYLAYETVAQIVDLALLVKKDAEATTDALVTCMPSVSVLSQNQALLNSTSSSTVTTPSTPNHTPPSTPTTPTTSNVPFLPSPTPSTSSQGSTNSSKAKKKRKSKSSASVTSEASMDCIQPWHIREAMRRYNHYMGPMAPFAPHIRPTTAHRTVCC